MHWVSCLLVPLLFIAKAKVSAKRITKNIQRIQVFISFYQFSLRGWYCMQILRSQIPFLEIQIYLGSGMVYHISLNNILPWIVPPFLKKLRTLKKEHYSNFCNFEIDSLVNVPGHYLRKYGMYIRAFLFIRRNRKYALIVKFNKKNVLKICNYMDLAKIESKFFLAWQHKINITFQLYVILGGRQVLLRHY